MTGGHEEESEDGVVTEDDDFLTVFVSGTDSGGVFVSDTGTGDATFTWSPSLQTASVSGTITTRGGRSITVNLSWEATGPKEVDTNTTTFPGFTGHFVGQRRDAVATGTVVLDGRQFGTGSTAEAPDRDARGHQHQQTVLTAVLRGIPTALSRLALGRRKEARGGAIRLPGRDSRRGA